LLEGVSQTTKQLARAAQAVPKGIYAFFRHGILFYVLLSNDGIWFWLRLWFLPKESIEHVSVDSLFQSLWVLTT